MYLTESDLRLLASEGVNWYEQEDVDKVLNERAAFRSGYRMAHKRGEGSADAAKMEEVRRAESETLAYDWRSEEERLGPNKDILPYKNTFAVYRIVCKYGYKTGSDPKGLIPKFCTFDFEPESQTILRARTYPHFHERKNYFHFKLGHAPDSYWGFGYGARLINDDFIESNAVDLYLDGAAIATFRPFVCLHPEQSDGVVPFRDGLGPGKIGYVRNIGEFQPFEIPPPPEALIRNLLPITKTRAGNKTSVTSLVQGQTETADPRSPAQKTRMLLGEAWVGIDSQIEDWNVTGWNPLANFVWETNYENLVWQGKEAFEDMIEFPGLAPDLENTNRITAEELKKKIEWQSQASTELLNPEARVVNFLRHFEFFSPILQQLGAFNPDLFKKYFLRWMRMAARELQIRGFRYLIPSAEELGDIPMEQMSQIWDALITQLRAGQSPETFRVQGAEGGRARGEERV
jgi:hypothetical protein